jgi:hypothetical protein
LKLRYVFIAVVENENDQWNEEQRIFYYTPIKHEKHNRKEYGSDTKTAECEEVGTGNNDALSAGYENGFSYGDIVNAGKKGRCDNCGEIGRFAKYGVHAYSETTTNYTPFVEDPVKIISRCKSYIV